MINPSVVRKVPVLGLAALCAGIGLMGCGGEEAPPPVARSAPKPPPPPPAPTVTSIETLMANYRIDPRVILAEDQAPDNDPDRIAVLEFFDAFVRGDNAMVSDMLSLTDRLELDALVASGDWQRTVEDIAEVELQCGDSEYGQCVLALFEVGLEFQPQLWYFNGEDTGYTFDAAASPPDILSRLSGDNWIQVWHDVLEEELALAERPDEDVSVPQQVIDGGESNTNTTQSTGPGMQPGNEPSGPGGPPRRRVPSKTPRKPPGPGGPGGR